MSQPSYVHVGAAATSQKPASTFPRFFISNMCEILFVTWLIITPWYYIFYHLPPRFSVQLAPAGRGLDVDDTAAPMPTAFHGALHASNRRATERCYRDGEVAVTYGGFAIASGRVPGFCVPAKGSREVPFLETADGGVGLPERLRDRMDAARKIGALELEVQVRLLQAGRPTRMWCNARMGGPQPPDETVCTVFALQNWFDLGA
ncbi:hypothetical protein EJB05_17234, partial [Eragrostis curvula]